MPGITTHRYGQIRAALFAAAIIAILAAKASAAPAVAVSFDGPDTRWRLVEGGAPARLLAQQCVPGGARNAAGSERVVVAAAAGQSVFVACEIGRMPAEMDEFRARLWVKSSRPGVQLAVRVVFPRSLDAKSNSPITTIVRGPHLQQPGHWQQLELSALPRLLADQVRVLRTTPNASPLDPREAFVDAIVLAIPGDPQGTEIIADELEVEGVLMPSVVANVPNPAPKLEGASGEPQRETSLTIPTGPERVRLQGTSLLVDGKPFALRAVEWNGEPLDFLAERGFNAVAFREVATIGQLSLAERHALWLICPPPAEGSIEPAQRSAWNCVLAWRLADSAAQDDPGHFRNWADEIRARHDLPSRPIVIAPQSEWSALSEVSDILLAGNPRDGITSPQEFGEWLTARGRLARPGTPLWTSISTQYSDRARAQMAALARQESIPLGIDDDQIEALVRVVIMQGSRGVLFRSTTPLNASDAPTRRRAALLELINRQLQLIAPWVAGGSVAGQTTASDKRTAAILWVDRARLVVPLEPEHELESKKQVAPPNTTSFSFTVPGIPDSSQAFLLTPGSMRQLTLKRVAGGTRIAVDGADDSMIVITQDPQVIGKLRQSSAREGAAALRSARDVAAMRASAISESSRRLAELGLPSKETEAEVASAVALLRQADAFLAAGRFEPAHTLIAAARKQLRRTAHRQRQFVVQQQNLSGFPLAIAQDSIATLAKFSRSKEQYSIGDNLLYGGDFENLDELTQFGWQHYNDPTAGAIPGAELSSIQPYHGRFALRLFAESAAANETPLVTRSPIRIVSPPMAIAAGELVEITGWARVKGATPGEHSVLEIEDSFGGPELALRVPATESWQSFQIIRAATETEFQVAFSLIAAGSAEIDAVMVRPLRQPIARRLPEPGGWPASAWQR